MEQVNVKYIGTTDTKVRVSGVKIDVKPDAVFEMPKDEAELLLNGPYRYMFIEDGAELTSKQNKDNQKPIEQNLPTEPEDEEEDEDEVEDVPDHSVLIESIKTADSIDALNAIATDVANDDAICDNEEVNTAIEEKMNEFLSKTEEEVTVPETKEEIEEETEKEEVKEEKPKKKSV